MKISKTKVNCENTMVLWLVIILKRNLTVTDAKKREVEASFVYPNDM